MCKINIRHHVHAIHQPNPKDCWATAVAMVLGRASEAGVDHVKKLARAGGVVPAADGGLYPHQVPLFARAVQLYCHNVLQSPQTPQTFARLMKRGPIAVTGMFFTLPSVNGLHAVTVCALMGDGTPEQTEIYFLDPGTGRSGHDSFRDFVENDAAIDFILSRDR